MKIHTCGKKFRFHCKLFIDGPCQDLLSPLISFKSMCKSWPSSIVARGPEWLIHWLRFLPFFLRVEEQHQGESRSPHSSFLPPVEEATISTLRAVQVWVVKATKDPRTLEPEGLLTSCIINILGAESVEVQRGFVVCPRPHSKPVAKPGLEATSSIPCLL